MEEESYKIKPTLVGIRCQITAAVAFAQIYAESHPQHAEDLRHFVQRLQDISNELVEAVYGRRIMN